MVKSTLGAGRGARRSIGLPFALRPPFLLLSVFVLRGIFQLFDLFVQSATAKILVVLHHLDFLGLELLIPGGLIPSRGFPLFAGLRTFNGYNFAWHNNYSKPKKFYLYSLS